jgi:DNA-binding PadR family transcriptional regulator
MKQVSNTTLYILIVLALKPCHGYEVMQQVGAATDGEVRLGPGTLYGAIKRLLEDKLIEPLEEVIDESSNEERRRYYQLTDAGRKLLATETEKMERTVRHARTALSGFSN